MRGYEHFGDAAPGEDVSFIHHHRGEMYGTYVGEIRSKRTGAHHHHVIGEDGRHYAVHDDALRPGGAMLHHSELAEVRDELQAHHAKIDAAPAGRRRSEGELTKTEAKASLHHAIQDLNDRIKDRDDEDEGDGFERGYSRRTGSPHARHVRRGRRRYR